MAWTFFQKPSLPSTTCTYYLISLISVLWILCLEFFLLCQAFSVEGPPSFRISLLSETVLGYEAGWNPEHPGVGCSGEGGLPLVGFDSGHLLSGGSTSFLSPVLFVLEGNSPWHSCTFWTVCSRMFEEQMTLEARDNKVWKCPSPQTHFRVVNSSSFPWRDLLTFQKKDKSSLFLWKREWAGHQQLFVSQLFLIWGFLPYDAPQCLLK